MYLLDNWWSKSERPCPKSTKETWGEVGFPVPMKPAAGSFLFYAQGGVCWGCVHAKMSGRCGAWLAPHPSDDRDGRSLPWNVIGS